MRLVFRHSGYSIKYNAPSPRYIRQAGPRSHAGTCIIAPFCTSSHRRINEWLRARSSFHEMERQRRNTIAVWHFEIKPAILLSKRDWMHCERHRLTLLAWPPQPQHWLLACPAARTRTCAHSTGGDGGDGGVCRIFARCRHDFLPHQCNSLQKWSTTDTCSHRGRAIYILYTQMWHFIEKELRESFSRPAAIPYYLLLVCTQEHNHF